MLSPHEDVGSESFTARALGIAAAVIDKGGRLCIPHSSVAEAIGYHGFKCRQQSYCGMASPGLPKRHFFPIDYCSIEHLHTLPAPQINYILKKRSCRIEAIIEFSYSLRPHLTQVLRGITNVLKSCHDIAALAGSRYTGTL